MDDPRYPAWLRTVPDPPALLHVLGAAEALSHPAGAVVGARIATPYGLGVAKALGRDLVVAGYAVVSGGARGIDSAAHQGALDAGGVTVAVMGSGLDVPYPKENRNLFERIAVSGAVVSEFPFGTGPQPRFFPFRNRIIAGLGHGVVVVEGARESGSLITARLAADFGREVFAVPGPITSSLSDGPHELIQAGAKLVRRLGDILEELPFAPESHELRGLSGDPGDGSGADGAADINNDAVPGGAAILAALDAHRGSTADELSATLGLAPGELLGSLLELELMGRIQQWPGGRFVRKV
ncbi:MAG: DNA-protecting protein DprA [Acidobacteria bacterium]|nr:DNA-protecting protein DprA [Acidobacteriota bacterium]